MEFISFWTDFKSHVTGKIFSLVLLVHPSEAYMKENMDPRIDFHFSHPGYLWDLTETRFTWRSLRLKYSITVLYYMYIYITMNCQERSSS